MTYYLGNHFQKRNLQLFMCIFKIEQLSHLYFLYSLYCLYILHKHILQIVRNEIRRIKYYDAEYCTFLFSGTEFSSRSFSENGPKFHSRSLHLKKNDRFQFTNTSLFRSFHVSTIFLQKIIKKNFSKISFFKIVHKYLTNYKL